MVKKLLLLSTMLLSYLYSGAQISPPGLGETKTALWAAAGILQTLSAKDNVTVYTGMGRISGAEEVNPLREHSIIVLNAEVSHKLSSHFNYSYAVSYRCQNLYDEPGLKQEFRMYGRFGYTLKAAGLKWKTTIRQEARKFYAEELNTVEEDFQLRSRLKTQLVVPIGATGKNSISASAEALFAINNYNGSKWDSFSYKESRFCIYYSYSPATMPVTFDVGYMNNIIGHGSSTADANYIAFDVVLKDPF